MWVVSRLRRVRSPRLAGQGRWEWRAYRTERAEGDGAALGQRSLAGRIIQLSDGRTVRALKEAIFQEELRAGGVAADIGLWQPLLDRDVTDTILTLAERGYLRLVSTPPGAGSAPEPPWKRRAP